MPIVGKFKITKGGESGILLFTNVPYPMWLMDSKVSWFPSTGTWAVVRNATKFRLRSSLLGNRCSANGGDSTSPDVVEFLEEARVGVR